MDGSGAADLEDGAVVEVVGARSSLERAERDAGATQRRDVTEVVATDRPRLVVVADRPLGRQAVRGAARRAVELVRRPVGRLGRAPVDGEALRATRVELESDVRYFERLAFRKRQQQHTTTHRFVKIIPSPSYVSK